MLEFGTTRNRTSRPTLPGSTSTRHRSLRGDCSAPPASDSPARPSTVAMYTSRRTSTHQYCSTIPLLHSAHRLYGAFTTSAAGHSKAPTLMAPMSILFLRYRDGPRSEMSSLGPSRPRGCPSAGTPRSTNRPMTSPVHSPIPERFVNGPPVQKAPPAAAWINPPPTVNAAQSDDSLARQDATQYELGMHHQQHANSPWHR